MGRYSSIHTPGLTAVEIRTRGFNDVPQNEGRGYLSMSEFQLIHVGKRASYMVSEWQT